MEKTNFRPWEKALYLAICQVLEESDNSYGIYTLHIIWQK